MKVIICENYEEVSRAGADIIASVMKEKPACVLGLATGSTPVGMYSCLSEMNKNGEIDFSPVTSFNLDEYYPLAPTDDQSYRYFMNENLFSKININIENTHVLNGLAPDTDAECAAYDKMIEEHGGIDIQVLGIGQNGHIAFNEPDGELYVNTHLTGLTQNTIEANSRFFEKIEDVPTKALTMGIGSIMAARKIILLATGKNKHEAVKYLLGDKITTNNPASMLKLHRDVVIICDKAAYCGE